MPDVVPFAVIQIGVSLALASILIVAHRKLYPFGFLYYWALYWATIAAGLIVGPLSLLLDPFPQWLWLARMCAALAGLCVAWFAARLAGHRGREFGSGRLALVVLSLVYAVHNLLLGASGLGLHFYRNGSYSPWAATVGILLQIALTIALAYQAFARAQESTRAAWESDRRFRSMLENIGLAGVILDRHGYVLFCNPYLLGLLGRPADEVLGRNWVDCFLAPAERKHTRGVLAHGFETGEWPVFHEYSILSNSGEEVRLQWYHTTLRNAGGEVTGVASLGVDITQQRLLEEQFRQAQKMETLGRLAGGVAHDFNNHLTVINGYAEVLLSQLKPDDPMRAKVKNIRYSGKEAAELTRQLLAFSRKQQLLPRPLSLNEAIREAEGMLRRLVREEIEMRIVLGPDLGITLADPSQMNQVLLNLVMNANDAIEGEGNIMIRTSNFRGRNPELNPDGQGGHGQYVMLMVQDTGCGMDHRMQQKIFEPFFTNKAEGKGTGLGLATVYGIVKQAGGWVEVTSEVGVGSIFRVYLPRVNAPAQVEVAGEVETVRRGSGVILLVEDQAPVRTLAASILSSAGYTVLEASGGQEALELASDPSVGISLLMTDIVMPEMRGDELARRLKIIRPGTPVLSVSGYPPFRETTHENPGGYSAYLQKPYTPAELLDKVGQVLQSPRASW